jgi:hypothetical protein
MMAGQLAADFVRMTDSRGNFIPGLLVAIGLAVAGYLIGQGFVHARVLDRSVEVKGLAEREVPADTAIWPVQIVAAGDDLQALLVQIEGQSGRVVGFLADLGFTPGDVSVGAPNVLDRQAQNFGDPNTRFRYSVAQTITVFTEAVATVREAGGRLLELGKEGIVVTQNNYDLRTQYLFNGLNDIKPEMIEEATRNARRVAEKFAGDSDSVLGKIRSARQGQFSIQDRDSNNPHIKRVRVVSTLEYYLVD